MKKTNGWIKAGVYVLSIGVVLGLGAVAHGLINPNFTPIHLVEQSELVVMLKFEKGGKAGKITATIDKVLKGKPTMKTFTIDLSTSVYKEHASAVEAMIKSNLAKEPVLFFIGDFVGEGADEMAEEMVEESEGKAYLGIGKNWVAFLGGKDNVWEMDKIDNWMLGCWNGGPDMLLRCVKYILSDEDADVPTRTEAEWGDNVKVGNVKGTVCSLATVDLKGDGTKLLYVASDGGDQLFSWDRKTKKFTDVMSQKKLDTKSKAAVWADFNGDGRLDLLSWDGKALGKQLQTEDGTFKAVKLGLADALKDGCIGLGIADAGKNGIPAVVASTKGSPILLLPDKGDGMTAKPLSANAPNKKLGAAGICLIGDFDNDALPDIIQPFANSGLIYKATGPAAFEAPKAIPVALGVGRSASCMGDYDMDGVMDIMCAAEDFAKLWHNYGQLKFVESFYRTGEPSYIAKPMCVGCATGDINNDGRQDFLLIYSGMRPQIFFNRGFRSYGHSHMLDLAELDILEQAEEGQYQGMLADINGDGAQDMIISIVKDGEVHVFFRDSEDALALSVALPLKGVNAGPVAVTGWAGDRCLGAWNVVAGTRDAFLGILDAGPITIKWKLPGGKEQKKEIIIEDKPVRFVIK